MSLNRGRKNNQGTVEQLDAPESRISGLRVIHDFISREEEEQLQKDIELQNWNDDLRRKVQQYGWKFQHQTHALKEYLGPLPTFCAEVTQRIVDQGLFPYQPDQMIINHYAPGQGILAHVDNVDCFTDYVVSIALGSSCIMEFTHIETGARVDVFFERRTAVLLSGAARYEWKHAIPASTHDEWKGSQYRRKNRVSLTWRKVVLTEKLQKMIDSRRTRAEQESDKPSDAIAM